MVNGDFVIIGLPSEGLQGLADALGVPHRESRDIRRLHDNPDEDRPVTPEWMMERLTALLQSDGAGRALLVYQTPWGFLRRQLKRAASAPGTDAQLERFAANAFGFWHAYHASLIGLRGQLAERCLLLNGDHHADPAALGALLEERAGLRITANAQSAITAGEHAGLVNEEAYWQVADRFAPDCLELYALLESSAELLGREPDFGFTRYPRREGRSADLLRPELKALSHREQAELYLLQIAQLREELEHYVELNRQNEREIADLRVWRVSKIARALGRKGLALGKSVGSAVASLPGGAWFTQFLKTMTARQQARTIRSSGLFDENWYIQQYPDVAQAGLDPVEHYLKFGVAEGRNPSARFSTQWYLDAYADVASSGLNPLVHYIEFGKSEGRRPFNVRRHVGGKG